jgi:hypothetical protein
MRNKFKIDNGDYMDYFTAYVDGEWFICVRKNVEMSDKTKTEK